MRLKGKREFIQKEKFEAVEGFPLIEDFLYLQLAAKSKSTWELLTFKLELSLPQEIRYCGANQQTIRRVAGHLGNRFCIQSRLGLQRR